MTPMSNPNYMRRPFAFVVVTTKKILVLIIVVMNVVAFIEECQLPNLPQILDIRLLIHNFSILRTFPLLVYVWAPYYVQGADINPNLIFTIPIVARNADLDQPDKNQ